MQSSTSSAIQIVDGTPDIIVRKDGAGDFTTVAAALAVLGACGPQPG